MKAIRIYEPWLAELVDIPEPTPKPGEALIKIKSVGICGSDIEAYRGTNVRIKYPRIIGHEVAGVVLSAPADNPQGLVPGDRVVLDPYLYCGKCYPCSIGRANCCENLKVIGVQVDGALTEFFCHPANLLYSVPDEIPWDILPLAEPLTIALHAINRAKVKSGEHVVILGATPVGLLQAMLAKLGGAEVIMVDSTIGRLFDAQRMGIQYTLNPTRDNIVQKVKEITTHGAEVVIDASGEEKFALMTIDLVSYAGRIVFSCWTKGTAKLPTNLITEKELNIIGSRTSTGEFVKALDMIKENKLNVRQILTQTLSLSQAAEALPRLEKNSAQYLKVHILMS